MVISRSEHDQDIPYDMCLIGNEIEGESRVAFYADKCINFSFEL